MDLDLRPLALPAAPCGEKTLLIAGPCAAETEAQVMQTARELADFGVRIFRAGIWKPRTKPGGFEGKGLEALPWLRRVNEELGMITATEVATPTHIEAALKAGVGLLWIGARTATNPFSLQEMADALRGVDIPILVKNPVNPDMDWWSPTIESSRCKTPRSHPSRLLYVRKKSLPQRADVERPHRTAPAPSESAHYWRSKPYRRQAFSNCSFSTARI